MIQQLGAAAIKNSSDAATTSYVDLHPDTGALAAPVGWRVGPQYVLGCGTGTFTTGVWNFTPIWITHSAQTFDAMVINVVTAQSGGTGTLVMTALFADDGTGYPDTGTVLGSVTHTVTSTGTKTTTFGTPVTLAPGVYWLGTLYYAGSVAPTTAPAVTSITNAVWPFGAPSSVAPGTTLRAYVSTAATYTGLPGSKITSANMGINGGSSAAFIMLRRSA